MKVHSPESNIGRTIAVDDVHHRTRDETVYNAKRAAKALSHAARQEGRKMCQNIEAEVDD
ncbi:MAG: hypothetical protein ACRC3J_05335 [Culicoidibacterales bacterium]